MIKSQVGQNEIRPVSQLIFFTIPIRYLPLTVALFQICDLFVSTWLLGVDGIFWSCPNQWYQLITICGEISKTHWVPLIYCFCPEKQDSTCTTIFAAIKEKLSEIGLELSAEYFMATFWVSTYIYLLYMTHSQTLTWKVVTFILLNAWENLLQIMAIKQVFQIVWILLHLLDVQ